ncbi:MAG: response regulator [Clostridiales bacterium]|jgi:PAS domain S-box-containing protein|nr:response regulator [Clostridiales bacterium]
MGKKDKGNGKTAKDGRAVGKRLDRFFVRLGMGMRSKLVTIFLTVKVIPIILIAVIAWAQFSMMGVALTDRTRLLEGNVNASLRNAGDVAEEDSKKALTASARENIERMTTDAARAVAKFLYDRDDDVRFLSAFDAAADPGAAAEVYANFIRSQRADVVAQGDWVLGKNGQGVQIWEAAERPAPSAHDPYDPSGGGGYNYYNGENEIDPEDAQGNGFNYRGPDGLVYESRPLYDEIAFIGSDGAEAIKVTWGETRRDDVSGAYGSDLNKAVSGVNGGAPEAAAVTGAGTTKIKHTFDPALLDLSEKDPLYNTYTNTFAKAESEFMEALPNLQKGEIFVSDVIGAYVGTNYIGMYTPDVLKAAPASHPNQTLLQGIGGGSPEDFMEAAAQQAFSGAENPFGERFEGIVRWAMPVYGGAGGNELKGYVTFALNHDHLMELTDHLTPSAERYTELSDAYEGNYAFIWDYQCRSICHPRHHSIVGFDAETGLPEIPWLEDRIYDEWQAAGADWDPASGADWSGGNAANYGSGINWHDFVMDPQPGLRDGPEPRFTKQSRSKKPAPALTKAGFVGLDGRYLNNAPQCTGWMNLTEDGGSGSFYILWSGLWKLTTAAAIPYYTGHYAPSDANGHTRRGFGMFTIGAGLEDFQKPAADMAGKLNGLIDETAGDLAQNTDGTQAAIRQRLNSTTWTLTLITLVLLTLVILVALWLASYLTGNITRLNRGVARFRSGERQFRFRADVKDEFGQLADSFDGMADGIVDSVKTPLSITDMDGNIIYMNEQGLSYHGKALDEVVGKPYRDYGLYPADTEYDPIFALNENREPEIYHWEDRYVKGKAGYFYDKDGRKLGYIISTADVTELAQATEAANQANEHKGEFLARMSHEIRTPMNAIMGITSIVERKLGEIQNGGDALDDVKAHLRQIENSSQHLLSLLNDILDLSKIDAGKIEMVDEAVDMAELADTVSTMIRPRCAIKGIVFETHFDDFSGAAYLTDSLRLRQVLINLLGNAVKFTPELGRVEFRVEKGAAGKGGTPFKFTVRDNGIGMEESVVSNLFKPFEQGDRTISRKYGGTGLGLAISGKIVEMMGGKIAVRSEPGKGSEFSFELRLKESAPIPREEKILENAEGKFAGKRVLLVDDVEINRMIVSSLLEPTGVQIDEAADGADALERFAESLPGTYDIILMDIQMPAMDGYAASEAIRACGHPDAQTVPIIALTANAFKDDIDRAIAHGMNAHIAKPVEYEKLIEIFFKYLK